MKITYDPQQKKDLREYLNSVVFIIKWLVIAVLVGALLGVVGALFHHVLTAAQGLRQSYPYIVYGLPAGGLLIVLLYYIFHDLDDRGTNAIVASIKEGSDVPFKMAPLIFASTAITQLFGGSAGREGAALQLGGSIAKKVGKIIRLDDDSQKIIVMCGMSAGFCALFGTPLAAAVFAIEVGMIGVMQYSALVPCVVSSLTAKLVSGALGVHAESFFVGDVMTLSPLPLLKIALLGAVSGIVSILFCYMLHKTEHLFEKVIKNQFIRIFVGGVIVVLFTLIIGSHRYLGTGMTMVEGVFHGEGAKPYDFILKMLLTSVTIAAGFKGGEIVPSFTIGATLGAVLALPLNLPVGLGAACCMVGLFCGVTNSPITSLLIAFEMFGFDGMPYYLVAVSVSYLLSGKFSLYSRQTVSDKIHTI